MLEAFGPRDAGGFASYAYIRCVREDEDADLDRVADCADHDGVDEGADARLVDADRVGDRLLAGL